ncbi:MAG: MerR family transcriptional regulator [Pseudomonadota bacterium]
MDYLPIGRVADLTGIAPVTLRAWERRYGLPTPRRTASGHRLYSMDEVALLRRVLGLMESGYSISRAVERLRAEQKHGVIDSEEGTELSKWRSYRERMLDAIDRFDTAALDTAFNEPLTLFPIDLIIDEVLLPVLEQVGDEWESRADGIAREHFFSAYLRNKIGARFNHEVLRGQGPSLLLACLPGEAHEMGLLLFGLTAGARNFRILYLGADLPLSQLPPVVERVAPAGIVLSGTTIELTDSLEQALAGLASSMDTPICLGGEMAETHHDSLEQLGVISVGRDFRAGAETIIKAVRGKRG